MGWNDRLENDPYIPAENNADDYYAQQYSHEEWLAYLQASSTEQVPAATTRNPTRLFKRIFNRLRQFATQVKSKQNTPF